MRAFESKLEEEELLSDAEDREVKAIRNYTSTLLEFKIAKARLDYLLLKREELEVKYCGVKGISYDNIGTKNQPSDRDGLLEFVIAITTPDPNTGMSLDDEIEEKSQEVVNLYQTLTKMTKALTQLQDIEAQLYRAIVIDGKKVSQAVKDVAEANYIGERQIYRTSLKNIQNELEKVQKMSVKCQ